MALDAHLLLRSSGLIARHSFSVTTLPPWHSSFMKKAVSFNTVFCLSVGFACHVAFLGSVIGLLAVGWVTPLDRFVSSSVGARGLHPTETTEGKAVETRKGVERETDTAREIETETGNVTQTAQGGESDGRDQIYCIHYSLYLIHYCCVT